MNKERKRFIAGAVCPRCGELDKLFVYHTDGKKFRECVNCDFLEEQRFAPIARELETRVASGEVERIVRIVAPSRDEH